MIPDNPFHEYSAQVAPVGSALYYSLLFTPDEKKQAIIALHAYQQQLKKITENYRGKELSKTKLQWWQQEWQRMFDNNAQHPIAKTLQKTAIEKNLSPALFQEWVDAALLKLDSDHFCTEADLAAFCYRETGSCTLLSASILGYSPISLPGIIALAETMALVNMLLQFSLHIRQGRCFLPLEWFEQQQIKIDDLQDLILNDSLKIILQKTAALAHQKFIEGMAKISSADKKTLLPIIIQATLADKLGKKIVKNNFSVLTEQVDLMPLTKLMTALRSYYRFN